MKKILSMVTTLLLLFSLMIVPFNASALNSGDMEGIIWEDFSGRKVGEKFGDDMVICTEKEGSAVAVNTLGALGGVNALKLNYNSLRGYHNIEGDQGFKLNFSEPKSLDNISSLMLYVRMPLSKADDQGNNWGKSGIAVMLYLGDYIWTQLQDKTAVQILSKDGREWQTIETYQMYLDLPTGFEGYIKINIKDFKSGSLNDSINKHSVNQVILQFSNMGAQCGAGYINAVYGLTKDTDSVKIKLNNEVNARYLTTGATESDLSKERSLIDAAMKGKILQNFSTYPIGYELDVNGMVKYQHKTDIKAKLVKNVCGMFNTPTIELSSPTLGGIRDSDPFYEIKYPAHTYMDDFKAVLFYIKCAGPHPNAEDESTFRFNFMSELNGETTWSLLGEGHVQYLELGASRWLVPSSDDQGIIKLPANFEGYIYVDMEELKSSPIADSLKDRVLLSSTLQFQAVGGDAGNCYIDGIYAITDYNDKNTMLITFNDCDVYNLSTNNFATPADVATDRSHKGDVYDEIPRYTSNVVPSVEVLGKESCKITWETVMGLSSYRVDLFYPFIEENTGKVKYMCSHSEKVSGTEIEIKGLESATRYYAVIYGLNKSGASTVVLKYKRFTSGSDVTLENLDDSEYLQKAPTISLGSHSSAFPFVVILIIAAAVLVGACVVVLLIVKKRKGR